MSCFSRTMLPTALACLVVSGCDGALLDPGSAAGANASIVSSLRSPSAPVTLSLSDSALNIGDTVRVSAVARNIRTNRDVTREMKFLFSSSDTVVASVDRRGLVTAKSNGSVKIHVRSLLGIASVSIGVGMPVSVPVDTTLISSLPARADTLPTVDAPVVVPSAPAVPVTPSVPVTPVVPVTPIAPVELGVAPPFNTPMLPAASVDVAVPRVTGRTHRVPAGDNAALQSALAAAVGGDEIVLPAGSEFVGSFTLPKHSGSIAVTVRGEGLTTPVGTRLTPAAAASLPRIVTTNVFAAIQTEEGASDWHLMGLNISLRAGAVDNYGIVRLGTGGERAMSQLVSDIVLDRVMISGGETGNTSRCVAFNGNSLAVVDSWLAECHAKGRDAQAIGGWTGIGPFLIENNHLEGSGQNIMFGGADPAISNVTPSDITIRGNHLYKPLSWGGGRWTVKAAFELKNARRVLFEGNVIENHWADAQVGFAILFQTVNQDGGAPWSKIQDVTVRNNIIRNSTSGFNLLSRMRINGAVPDEPMKRILVRNNLFLNVGKDPISGAGGRMLQLMSDHEDVTVMQNTWFGAHANNALMFDGESSKRLTLFNNVFGDSEYGVMGSGFQEGAASITQFAPGSVIEGNAFVGRMERLYPSRNAFPAAIDAGAFVSSGGGDYTLRATMPFSANASTIVGVNGQALARAIANAVSR
jgi:Right handed beta helix region/Bacterial Ig-like domain (group 2)